MTSAEFIGLDVHKTSISVAVLNEDGKLVMQSVVATMRLRFWISCMECGEH